MNNSPRGKGNSHAEASPDLAHLSLVELRNYREKLSAEEERVSYWRRLVQARLDILVATRKKTRALTHEELIRTLGNTGMGTTRSALLAIHSSDPLPELPGLAELWETNVDTDDQASVVAAHRALTAAEDQLNVYRSALHSRLAAATGELITRYAKAPEICLDLIVTERPDVQPLP